MDKDQARELGRLLRERREQRGWTTPEVARRSGMTQSTVVRFEQGAWSRPSPEKLARLARTLELNLADVYRAAQYPLPSLPAYLRSKYRNLPVPARQELEAYLAHLSAKYGLDEEGPAPGEDETEDQ